MYVTIYLRRGIVYVPTVATTQSGLFVEVEPVQVVPLSNARELQGALERAMATEQEVIPDIEPPFPPPVVLKHAHARSMAEFERSSSTWSIDEEGGRVRLVPYVPAAEGGWTEATDVAHIFPPGMGAGEVARQVVQMLRGSS